MTMQAKQRIVIFLLLCEGIGIIFGSKCSETRKPHVTSCTIFYNCINLPDGGYVWVPAKCVDGLVFQPYLRMCVLPGDTWTCDNLSIESSAINDSKETAELIDPAQTSYHGFTQTSSPLTDRLSIGASYPIDGISELANLRVSATPYPLIEVSETSEESNDHNKKITKNVEATQSIVEQQGVENYWYQYFNSREKIPPRNGIDLADEFNYTRLKGFMNKILLYESVGLPLNRQFTVTLPSTTCNAPSTKVLEENKSNYLTAANNDVLNYLVSNYVLGTRRAMLSKSKKKAKKPSTATTTKSTEANQSSDEEKDSTTEISNASDTTIDSIIDGLKADNHVVAIEGNLGGKEYVTIAKYKSLSTRLNIEVIEVLECAKGVRLANRTDCTKYYTCDPETATVVPFSCSPKTAFNDYNRVCEAHRYKACVKERSMMNKVSTTVGPIIKTTIRTLNLNSTPMENPAESNPCQSTGKFVDLTSEKHYYICFSSVDDGENMNSIRMMCPNDLIFCQEKRVCTARRRCYE